MYDRAICVGYDQITLSATAVSSLPIMAAATGNIQNNNAALIRLESGSARFLMTGVTGVPTTGSGFLLNSSDNLPMWINGLGNLQRFQAIAVSGTPILDVLYFRSGMM